VLAHRVIKELQQGFKRDSKEYDNLYEIELGLEWTLKRLDHLHEQTSDRGG
jgi:hypothetical protein